MRTQFIPAVQKQFGNKCFDNAEYVAETLSEYWKVIKESHLDPIVKEATTQNRLGIHIKIPWYSVHFGVHFWQNVLKELLHPKGISLPSRKGIQHFIDTFRKQKSTSVQLKKELYCYFDYQTKTVYLLDSGDISSALGIDRRKLSNTDWKKIKELL